MKRICILLLFCVFVFPSAVFAQSVTTQVLGNSYTVGDEIEIRFDVTHSAENRVIPPTETAWGEELELVAWESSLPALQADGLWMSQFTATVRAWNPVVISTDPLSFQLIASNYERTVTTDPIDIFISSTLDQNTEFHDIRSVKTREISRNWGQYLVYSLPVLLAFIGLAYWSVKKIVSRPKKQPRTTRNTVYRTPYQTALLELDMLRNLSDDAHTSVQLSDAMGDSVDVVRRYLEKRHQVPALKRTSSELRSAITQKGRFSPETEESIVTLIKQADNVKYAEQIPEQANVQSYIDHLAGWIRTAHREVGEERNG